MMEESNSNVVTMQNYMQKLQDAFKKIPSKDKQEQADIRALLQMAERLNFRDGLLDTYNLNYFFKYADERVLSGDIDEYVACRFNMKRFSVINHQYGREKGTEILNDYILGLQEKIGDDGCVCRVQGDGFVMLFRREKLSLVKEYLGGSIIEVECRGTKKITLEAHVGYYDIAGTKTPEEIMDRISMALNIAKHVQKVPYVFFDEEIMKTIENEKWVESLFSEAMEKEEFLVFYQPKVTLDDYRLVGAEALCRWKHDGEMILPYRFIPVLEHSHLICELDFYILEHVCRDIKRWIEEGLPVVKVSVNLSRVHLGDVNLLEHVMKIVDEYAVPHEYLELELTETTTDVDFKELKHIVTGLREQGFSVAVDDFGVGYSSLNLIREMPWKVLKIDKSFLPVGEKEDEEDVQKKIMLKHIIGLAQNFGLECIAEGVETAEQVNILKENNCFLAQGYLFDRPLPVSDFEKRLNALA